MMLSEEDASTRKVHVHSSEQRKTFGLIINLIQKIIQWCIKAGFTLSKFLHVITVAILRR